MGQEIFDEMSLEDISDEPSIKSTIIRDPDQALLIVKTQIASLRIQSNNIIHKSEQVEAGTWYIHLKPGTHRISFQAERFISLQRRFYFNAKEVKGIRIRVIPAAERKEEKNTGIVVINSEPDSAQVYFNDQYYGLTPYIGKILAGRYKLELIKEPFLPYEKAVIIVSNEILPLNIRLDPNVGTLIVTTIPAGATVELDSRIIGVTPLEFSRVEMGRHRLHMHLDNYYSYQTEFTMSKEVGTESFKVMLKAKKSQLKLLGRPSKASIKINNQVVGTLPLDTLTMPYGNYHLNISNPGFYSFDENITIDKNDLYLYQIELKPKRKYSGLLYSTMLPGSGQIYSGRMIQGIIIGGAALTGLTVSLLLNTEYHNAKSKYNTDKDAYDYNTDLGKMNVLYKTMQESYSEMETAYNKIAPAVSITAAIWFYNMLDVVLFFPGQKGLYLSPKIQQGNNMVSINLEF